MFPGRKIHRGSPNTLKSIETGEKVMCSKNLGSASPTARAKKPLDFCPLLPRPMLSGHE